MVALREARNRSLSCTPVRLRCSWSRRKGSSRALPLNGYGKVFCIYPDSAAVKKLILRSGLHDKHVHGTEGRAFVSDQCEFIILPVQSDAQKGAPRTAQLAYGVPFSE